MDDAQDVVELSGVDGDGIQQVSTSMDGMIDLMHSRAASVQSC